MGTECLEKSGNPHRASIKNVGIIAHIDAGKTSLTEQILKRTGMIRYAGEVSEGTTVTDWLPQERERGISIISAAVTCPWKGVQVNLVDTPGHVDFTAEVERTLQVLDGVIAVFCGVHGVQAQSETVWRRAKKHGIPVIAFVNKLDREGAEFDRVVEDIGRRLDVTAVPMQIPVGSEGAFMGMADVLTGRLEDEDGQFISDMSGDERVWFARSSLVETLSDLDDSILEDVIESREPDAGKLILAVRRAVLNRQIVPIFGGSARKGLGIRQLLNAVEDYLPSPSEPVENPTQGGTRLQVFKVQRGLADEGTQMCVRVYGGTLAHGDRLWNGRTRRWLAVNDLYRMFAGICDPLDCATHGDIVMVNTDDGDVVTGDMLYSEEQACTPVRMSFPEPVVSVTMEGTQGTGNAALKEVLARMCQEDPTLQVHEGPLAGQWTLKGLGELHLEIVKDRLFTEYGLSVVFGKPQVTLRETIGKTGTGTCLFEKRLVTGETKKAGIELRLEPRERGKGLEIEFDSSAVLADESVGEFVERTVRQLSREGLGDDRPLTDMRIILERILCFEGETTEPALAMACRKALSDAVESGEPIVLEPVMAMEIVSPDECVGKLLDDIMARRGRVQEVNSIGNGQARIITLVPLGELFGYANSLRSLSCGRADFTAEPSLYVPLSSR